MPRGWNERGFDGLTRRERFARRVMFDVTCTVDRFLPRGRRAMATSEDRRAGERAQREAAEDAAAKATATREAREGAAAEELARKVIKAIDEAGLDDTAYSKREYVEAIGIIVENLELRRETTQDELERGES